MIFWSRPLLEIERQFVTQHFGVSLSRVIPSLRLYVRRVGDTRRALSMNGGRISMPKACFVGGDPRQSLQLQHPLIAGLFAHELLHQWQRLQGMAVTRQAAWLQAKAVCLRTDPYAYAACADPASMLKQFLAAQVEQQGQIWQDYVSACVAGQLPEHMQQVAAYVKGERSES